MTNEKRTILPNKKKGIADSISIKSGLESVAQKIWQERDFSRAKQLLESHIQDSGMNEISKKKILFNLTSIGSKPKLDIYLANSILNFERLGVN